MFLYSHLQGCIIVDEVFPEGNAGRDGRLCPGDQILSVNGMDCAHAALSQANLALSAPNAITTITVFREIQDESECGGVRWWCGGGGGAGGLVGDVELMGQVVVGSGDVMLGGVGW